MKKNDPLLPLPDACQRAGVDYIRAWRALVAGRVPAAKRGRIWFVDPAALKNLAPRAAKPRRGRRGP